MTLLVLDVRLPEDIHPENADELFRALAGLMPKFLPYVLSFCVLGLRWLSNIQVRAHGESVGREYVNRWLLYLLLITCVPFTTIILGRFGNFAPEIWVYAGNTILISAVAFRLMALTPGIEPGDHLAGRQVSLMLLIGSSVLAIGWSFVSARQALWALALNLAAPAITCWRRKSVQ